MARGPVEQRKRERQREKRDRQVRRALDALVLGELADFTLVLCAGCGLEQANRCCSCEDAWVCVCEHGCLLCGHEYATSSPRHEQALASLRLDESL